MRFVLMIEPQQGLSLRRPGRDRQARRGERLRGVLPLRPLRELPGPGRHTRRPTPGRSSPAWPATPSGSGWACSSRRSRSAIPGNFAKVVTTVDEMSGGRIEVGVGRRLERRGARAARAAVPADQGARRPARGAARDPARPVGRAGRLVVRGARPSTIEDALFHPKPVDVPGGRSGRSAAPGRGSSSAARDRRAASGSRRAGADEFNLTSPGPASSPRRSSRGSTPRARRSGAIPATMARSAMVGDADRPDDDEVRAREAALLAAFGEDAGGEDWLEERRERWIVGTADAGAGDGPRLRRRPASSGSCSRTSCPGTST